LSSQKKKEKPMGLFDDIVKRAVGKAVGDKAAEILGDLVNQSLPMGNRGGLAAQQPPQGGPWGAVGAPGQDSAAAMGFGQRGQAEPRKDHAWFAATLAEHFGDYEIREQVPVSELGGEGRPYSFLMSKDGAARAAIMLSEHNRCNNRAFAGARAACEAAGVSFINFFLHMNNKPDYVVGRIKDNLA
jgi:hypothetical protein